MSTFEIAVNKVAENEDWIEFVVGGRTCKARREPTGGQIAYVTLNMHKARKDEKAAGAILNFLDSLLDDDTQVYIMDLLLDPTNDFEIEQLMKILEHLMEQWTGRPTVPSSGSSSPPTAPGPSLPPATQESPSFAFPQTSS